MSTDKKTEDLIREKLNQREFDFDEKAWAEAEALIDAQEKRRKPLFWFFLSGFVILLGAASIWFFLPNKSGQESQDILSENAAQPETQKHEVSEKGMMEEKEQQEAAVKAENSSIAKANISSVKSGVQSQKKLIVSKKPEMVKTETAQDKKAVQSKVSGEQKSNENQAEKIANTENSNSDLAENGKTENQDLANETAKNDTEVKANTIAEAETPNLAEKAQADTSVSQAKPTQADVPAPQPPGKDTKNSIILVAGANAWLPYQGTASGDSAQWFGAVGPLAGLLYEHKLSKRFAFGLGAIYGFRGALNMEKSYDDISYNFGYVDNRTVISPTMLHFFDIPVYAKFNLTMRSHFLLGAVYMQPLAVNYKEQLIKETDFNSEEIASTTKTGQFSGFAPYDIRLFGAYEYSISDRFNIGLQFHYGFMDMTDNDYQSIKKDDRNIGLELLLKYHFINF